MNGVPPETTNRTQAAGWSRGGLAIPYLGYAAGLADSGRNAGELIQEDGAIFRVGDSVAERGGSGVRVGM